MTETSRSITTTASHPFLTLPGEKLILFEKQHWISLIPSLLATLALNICLFSTLLFVYTLLQIPTTVFATACALILLIFYYTTLKFVVDWMNHFYIISTRRILEVNLSPFYFNDIHNVLLDQVRITEVDIDVKSVVHDLLNVGIIVISFDRPSLDNTINMKNILNARTIGPQLSDTLESIMTNKSIWFGDSHKSPMMQSDEYVDEFSKLPKHQKLWT